MLQFLHQTRHLSTTLMTCAKKTVRGDITLVSLQSTVSNYTMQGRRQRLGDKLETLAFDPMVQKKVLFREIKKIKTMNSSTKDGFWMHPSEIEYPEYFKVDK